MDTAEPSLHIDHVTTDPTPDQFVQEYMRSPTNHCFACGPGNPIGLHLHFQEHDGLVSAEFVPGEWHLGWEGIMHGGLVTSILDEAMAYTLFFQGYRAVTARLQVRFRDAARQGDTLRVEARIIAEKRKLADVEAVLRSGDVVVAEASARFVKLGRLVPANSTEELSL